MLSLKTYRNKAKGLPDLLNYGHIIEPGIYLNKNGSISAGFYYRAHDVNSATDTLRSSYASKMNALLSNLGNGWSMHIDAQRLPVRAYPEKEASYFTNNISAAIDEERREYFEADNTYYETIYTIVLTFEPVNKHQARVADLMFDDDNIKKSNLAERMLLQFKNKLDEFEQLASNIMLTVERMTTKETIDTFGQKHIEDDYLKHVNFAISGKTHKVNIPPFGCYLDTYIGAYQFQGGVTPKIGNKFIGVVAINGFPLESYPNILEQLSNMQITYRWNTRFIFRDTYDALKDLNKLRKKWQQKVKGWKEELLGISSTKVDEHAVSMVKEIDAATATANSSLLAFGYYSSNIIIMDEDREALEYYTKNVLRIINNLGFTAEIEDVNCVEAYLGSLPGHTFQNVKRPIISTYNLAHYMPLSSIWSGLAYNPCDKYPPKSPPLLHTSAENATPFRLNLHVSDVGHTLIFGPTGAGKSTLLALMVAQFDKYKNGQVYAFDKGNALLPLTYACQGKHYALGEDKALSFAPLQDIDSDSKQSWANEWIEIMLELQGVVVTPGHRKSIHDAMSTLRNTESKTMTDFVANLQDSDLTDALSYYTLDGQAGHLLDAEDDALSLSTFSVFEMGELMNMGDKVLIPTLLYLFRKIEDTLDGRPTLLVLDEAWIMLGHKVFKEKIKEWLKTLRKANCAVVLATQSLSDADKSGLLDILQESCPTKIYLANDEAYIQGANNIKGPYDYYTSFGLNDAEIGIIANATKKREYFYKSTLGTRLFSLELGPLALSFVGASSKEDIKEIKRLHSLHGNAWVEAWLESRGVDYSPHKLFHGSTKDAQNDKQNDIKEKQ